MSYKWIKFELKIQFLAFHAVPLLFFQIIKATSCLDKIQMDISN